ncbi:MAG: Druantia anti-phage system protein DruA [Sphingomonas sp.]|jgi:hypothetical protein|uniref:Druantia anti-phage system protein DruA n=1 Tax=Sphingomonas sp. TaxID=28214 RepID=UPI003563EB5A
MNELAGAQASGGSARVTALLDREIEWLDGNRDLGEQALIYEACVRVLADLVRLRWRVTRRGYSYALENPSETTRSRTTAELVASKDAIRAELRPVVEEQRTQPSVLAFLDKMERGTKTKRSILELVAHPDEVRDRLAAAARLAEEERHDAVRTAVRPYLQRATGAAEEFTGIPLREVWRYFRYSWSIPQTPVPGRQLLYLVRDAAHPTHAVMGIASLNNCPLEMGETRETFIGWHRTAITRRFAEAATLGTQELQQELDWLLSRIEVSLAEVDWTNLVSAEEVATPTEAVIGRIHEANDLFAGLREDLLREIASGVTEPFDPSLWERVGAPPVDDAVLQLEAKASTSERMHVARRFLVAKKRAHALARLLQAKMVLTRKAAALVDPLSAVATLETDAVRGAINIVVEALKARRAGANMLEITTCGAVAPYGPLLGGKLVALLMMSPQVGADYRAAYGNPSIISSQMLNRPVVRDSALVYLGTTSLYVHGSSQYNRLRLPAGTIAPDQPELRYHPIGETRGFGTVQFSPETSKAIDNLVSSSRSFKDVNSVFGEGTSPKLRKMKQGMRLIGFSPDRMLQHQQRRLIYAVSLSEQSRDWLLERRTDLPTYLADPARYPKATEQIAEFWRRRWLAGRLSGQYPHDGGVAPDATERFGSERPSALGDEVA